MHVFFQTLLQNQVLWIQMTNNHQGKQWFAQEVVRSNLFQSEAIHWPATSPSKLWSQDHSGSSQISTPPVLEKIYIKRISPLKALTLQTADLTEDFDLSTVTATKLTTLIARVKDAARRISCGSCDTEVIVGLRCFHVLHVSL